MNTHRDQLLALNDPRLSAYLAADDEAARSEALECVFTEVVRPVARLVLAGYIGSEWPLNGADVEDITSLVSLRMLRKLRAATVLEEESVQNLEAYTVTLTRNCVRNFMRTRSPDRTRMKARLRYLFAHDDQFSMWASDRGALCGLAAWRQNMEPEAGAAAVTAAAAEAWRNESPVSSMLEILLRLGRPARLTHLVSACLSASPEARPAPADDLETVAAPQRDLLEARQYLEALWMEIRELPSSQQAALLLNLREPGSGNAAALLVALGIASLAELAAAVRMTTEELTRIWDSLPLDDRRIAAVLSVTRQQVINLRKSARKRLSRRMAMRGGPRRR